MREFTSKQSYKDKKESKMYEIRFLDNAGTFRVAKNVPFDKLSKTEELIRKIAKEIWVYFVPGWLQ
jgi:hypothetical protein